MIILITGSTGFIGNELVKHLVKHALFDVHVALRNSSFKHNVKYKSFVVGEINYKTNWEKVLNGVDVIIHLAARAHIMKDKAQNPLNEFRKVNTEGTLSLARAAVKFGVKRFIYISSIKVCGEYSSKNTPFTTDEAVNLVDPYAISKREAELGLLSISSKNKIEIVIIRPPLVYGPGVKANFFNLMKWLNKGIPLPFGSINNKRSFVALDNLVDLIICCINHPKAKNQIFLVSDNEDISTTELLKKVNFFMGGKSHLIPVNQKLLAYLLNCIGKKNIAQRVCASLQVDISKTKELLNWLPKNSLDIELQKTVQHFLNFKRND